MRRQLQTIFFGITPEVFQPNVHLENLMRNSRQRQIVNPTPNMNSARTITLNIPDELRTELMLTFARGVKIYRHDMPDLPAGLNDLFAAAREKCGLRDTVREFLIYGGRHNRDDGSIIEPAPMGVIGRLILNLNCKENYSIVRTGIEEYMQARKAKAEAATPARAKKISIPTLIPQGSLNLEDSQGFFLAPPACNSTMFLVSKAPRGTVRREGKLVPYLRPRTYDRLMIVIDFIFQPSPEEIQAFMKGLEMPGAADAVEGDETVYEVNLEDQLTAMEATDKVEVAL